MRDYLLVDGHSVIFAWPELRDLHAKRTATARETLIKRLQDYQDWSGVRVVVVFDGTGTAANDASEPGGIQVMYSRGGQTADSLIERLASNYARRFRLTVATGDYMEQVTVEASGADCISPEALRELIDETCRR